MLSFIVHSTFVILAVPIRVKKMSPKTWTDEQISSLISYYNAEPTLGWTKHLDYHNLPARNAGLRRIAELLGDDATPDMVKAKFETLRGQYTRELSKVKSSKASGAGTDQVYQVKWKFFQQLDFLRGVVTPKATTSNLPSSPPLESQQNEENEMPTTPSRPTSPVSCGQSASGDTQDLPRMQPPSKKQRKGGMTSPVANCMNRAMDMLQGIQEKATTPVSEPDTDGDSLFCKQLALKVREVTNFDLKIEMQFKIMKLVSETIREQNALRGDNNRIFRPF